MQCGLSCFEKLSLKQLVLRQTYCTVIRAPCLTAGQTHQTYKARAVEFFRDGNITISCMFVVRHGPTWHDDVREAQLSSDGHTPGEEDHVFPSQLVDVAVEQLESHREA